MNKIWLQIFVVMIGGSIAKSVLPNPLVWAGIDIVVLGVAYLILRRYPNINLKSSMMFLSGLTVVSILTGLRIISDMAGNIATLALLAWMMFGRGGSKFSNIKDKWNK